MFVPSGEISRGASKAKALVAYARFLTGVAAPAVVVQLPGQYGASGPRASSDNSFKKCVLTWKRARCPGTSSVWELVVAQTCTTTKKTQAQAANKKEYTSTQTAPCGVMIVYEETEPVVLKRLHAGV